MTQAPEHNAELLAMREEVTRLHVAQYEAFKHSHTSAVNAIKYDLAMARYVDVKCAYDTALREARKAYDEACEPASEVSHGQPF